MIRILLLTGFLAAPLRAQEEFKELFNGRDLTGWVNVNCAPETWTVKDGLLHCDGIPTGALRTEKQYENFILELEWRHLKPGGNAGVFIWAGPLSAPGQPFLRAIEVQVLDHAYGKSDWFTTHGDVFPIHGSSMKPFGRHNGQRSFPSEERSKGSPEWNHYRITCLDGTLKLAVNGKEVSGGENCIWRKGYIALESEGGIVDWRNIRIRELEGGKATPEQTAPLADSSVSLYDGRSLKNWTASSGAQWKQSDWQLAGPANGGTLTLDRKLADFRLQFDAKADAKEGMDNLPVLINGQPLPVKVTDKWTRFVVSRTGSRLQFGPEGAVPLERQIAEGEVSVTLQSDKPVRLAGIYVKPLP